MRYRWILGACCLSAVVYLLWPFAAWQWKDKVPLDVLVIDKTVPRENYREHLGLYWIMENQKITDRDGDFYQASSDYYGNHPRENAAERNLSIEGKPDLIYVADTYGVYDADLNILYQRGERSNLIYGGLMGYEWDQIIQAIGPESTLIMEFNSIASPTSFQVRRMVERQMNFVWTGWIGRYFSDVQSIEVPDWLKDHYIAQSGQPWPLNGSAIVFIDELDQVVLLNEEDFSGKVRFKMTPMGQRQYPAAKDSEYSYWFDVIVPGEGMIVDAVYSIEWSPLGLSKLEGHGIPDSLPAVVRRPDNKQYYFSGDYADIPVRYYAKWTLPRMVLKLLSVIKEDERFYWRSYVPIMEQILSNIQQTKYPYSDGIG